jgi:flavin reductase (DIM6/NTAB) family NADH-FMN oxidoreductase RutF
MTAPEEAPAGPRLVHAAELDRRQSYRLITTLVVPRPIGWLSTRGADGTPNLAPYSYFNAVAGAPMMVAASVGRRRDGAPKDALATIRESGAFCVNIVTERHLEAMVRTAGDYPPHMDEFEIAGLALAEAESVAAPYVADAPAVLECTLVREVTLDPAPNTLVIGEVLAVRLGPELRYDPERFAVDPASLRPVGRLGEERYTLLGDIHHIPRPRV